MSKRQQKNIKYVAIAILRNIKNTEIIGIFNSIEIAEKLIEKYLNNIKLKSIKRVKNDTIEYYSSFNGKFFIEIKIILVPVLTKTNFYKFTDIKHTYNNNVFVKEYIRPPIETSPQKPIV